MEAQLKKKKERRRERRNFRSWLLVKNTVISNDAPAGGFVGFFPRNNNKITNQHKAESIWSTIYLMTTVFMEIGKIGKHF